MAYLLFIDESGQDHRNSPYEVLSGMAIEDKDLWNFILAVQEAEVRIFGIRYSDGHREIKAKKILKRKVFRHAALLPEFDEEERRELARSCLEDGSNAGQREMAALAQAKLVYVRELFDICGRFRCKFFASIINDENNGGHPTDYLRKDYAYLFERFYYFLEDSCNVSSGIVVFDELDKSMSHILLDQMDSYFKRTENGRQRSGRIIPEPFFVHSDLSTGVQLADLAAYLISWAFRAGTLKKEIRGELSEFVDQLSQMRYRTTRDIDGNPNFEIWSFAIINNMGAGGQ